MEVARRKWVLPEVRRYGTFESATQGCTDKTFGVGDSFTFQAQPTALSCSAS